MVHTLTLRLPVALAEALKHCQCKSTNLNASATPGLLVVRSTTCLVLLIVELLVHSLAVHRHSLSLSLPVPVPVSGHGHRVTTGTQAEYYVVT